MTEQSEFKPHMTYREIALLVRHIPEAGLVLEFGTGGSTQLFFERRVRHLYSIDSDEAWLNKLVANPEVAVNLQNGRWSPIHTDIGEVAEWGMPVAKTPALCWLNYHQHCWEAIAERDFDLVLIDGRFRVACLCQSLLRVTNEKALFAFHDFFNRPAYHVVLEFVDVVAQAGTLAILSPKAAIDWKKLNLVLQAHQFVCN